MKAGRGFSDGTVSTAKYTNHAKSVSEFAYSAWFAVKQSSKLLPGLAIIWLWFYKDSASDGAKDESIRA